MPGPRGGTSKSSEWRAKNRKLEDAIKSKHQSGTVSPVQPNDESESCDDTQSLLHHVNGTGSMSPHTQSTSNCETEAELEMEVTHAQEYTKKSKQTDSTNVLESFSDSSSDSNSDEEDFVAHYLGEEDEEANEDDPGGIGPDPDDPGPEDDDDDDDGFQESDDSEDENDFVQL